MDVPTSWLAELATATGGGTPRKMSIGVSRNPPPTPNRPERKPIAQPRPRRTITFSEISAMGR